MSSIQPQPGPPATQEHRPQHVQQQPGRWARLKQRIFSNLNLNGRTPPRVQPQIGEWGPERLPTTRQKKRMRIYVSIALPVTMLACFALGWFVYFMMTGCYGFGLGCRGD